MTHQTIGWTRENLQTFDATDDDGAVLPAHRRNAVILWFVVGVLAAVILQAGQVRAMGGALEGLLFAGTRQEVHTIVEEELPGTPVSEGFGHDGQIFYAVGLDLVGQWVPDTLLSAPYRYRRILYPALASGFGILRGESLLWAMIALASLPVGLAAGSVAFLASEFRLPRWTPATVVLNPGTWLSAQLLTADNLALALGLLGVVAFVRRHDAWAVACLAAAVLSKEPSAAFALGVAVYAWDTNERSRSLQLVLGPALIVLAWWGYVAVAIGNPFNSAGNVAPPFAGIVNSVESWGLQRPDDWLYLSVALIGYVVSIWVLARGHRLWGYLAGAWLLVATLSSHLVWHVGNNAVRAFSPLIILGLIGLIGATSPGSKAASNPVRTALN